MTYKLLTAFLLVRMTPHIKWADQCTLCPLGTCVGPIQRAHTPHADFSYAIHSQRTQSGKEYTVKYTMYTNIYCNHVCLF